MDNRTIEEMQAEIDRNLARTDRHLRRLEWMAAILTVIVALNMILLIVRFVR